jgi:catechol 2,3-dioxygenase-like lactoylglutathione lyase family enzyme
MPIREFFHFMQLVGDHEQLHERYAQLLAPKDWGPKSWSDFDKRWATLGCVGPDFVLEIMEPGKDEADRNAPLPKFWHRHGDHLHSYAWYVDPEDMRPMAQKIADMGVKVLTPYPLDDPEAQLGTFFTHPKDTFGQLEFQALPQIEGNRDFHLSPDWSGDFWLNEFPLGLERTSHLTLVVGDLDAAQAFYAKGLDAPSFLEEETDDRLSSYCLVGTDMVIEIAQPKSEDSPIGKDLARHGNVPHAMTFKVADLSAAEGHIKAIGLSIGSRKDDTIYLDPAEMANAIVGFTVRELPGDPRS